MLDEKLLNKTNLLSNELLDSWNRNNLSEYELRRFWKKVHVPLNTDGSINYNVCWEWKKYRDKDGYGTFYHDNTSTKSHRYVYELYNGPLCDNECVCHSHDNPSCQNPLHLFSGTHLRNMNDMVDKKRSRISLGSDNVNTKFKENEIIECLNLVLLNKLQTKQDIIDYNNKFTLRIIKNILTKQNWGHVTNIFNEEQWNHITDTLNGYMTEYLVKYIEYEILTTSITNVDLAKKHNLTIHTMSKIRNYKHKYSSKRNNI